MDKLFRGQSGPPEIPPDTFKLLDSEDLKTRDSALNTLKKYEKMPWVTEHLIEYYIQSKSNVAANLIAGNRCGHEQIIMKKLHQAFMSVTSRRRAVSLFLHITSQQTPWLHKADNEPIVKDCIDCMMNEIDVSLLMDSVYIIVMLLPVNPDGLIKYFDSIFLSLTRLLALTYKKPVTIPDVHIIHLNVGIYSLFLRLYAIYPLHFTAALQLALINGKISKPFFTTTIQPMLSRLKLHPSLISGRKDLEAAADHWKGKEVSDIVAECANFSLDNVEMMTDYAETDGCPVVKKDPHLKIKRKKGEIDTAPNPVNWNTATSQGAQSAGETTTVLENDFFSPAENLGLSTPPGEACTPGLGGVSFEFGPIRVSSARDNLITPLNSTQETPQATETPAPTPLDDNLSLSRSRHASGPKCSLSHISIDEQPPASPMRKEFTALPPVDARKIQTSFSKPSDDELSIRNLPGLLEKISDTTSTQDDATSEEDDEVSCINDLSSHVNEFVNAFNRIRFNSMTVSEEKREFKTVDRPESCPLFSEEMNKRAPRSSSQASSLIGSRTGELIDEFITNDTADDAGSSTKCRNPKEDKRQTSSHHITIPSEDDCDSSPGAASLLDDHFKLLDRFMRLGSTTYNQELSLISQNNTDWTHFGGSPPADEIDIVRTQLLLLHTQLMYERQMRDLHAQRNRRLLRKVIKITKLEQQNQLLTEQLKKSEVEVFNLGATVKLQASQLSENYEEKKLVDSMKEQQHGELIATNDRLKYENEEISLGLKTKEEFYKLKCQELAEVNGKLESLQRDCQILNETVNRYAHLDSEVTDMKKKLLQLGENELLYQEKLKQETFIKYPDLTQSQEMKLLDTIDNLQKKLREQKEISSHKQSTIDLESRLKHQSEVIEQQSKIIESLKGEMREKLKSAEDKYINSQSQQQALEVRLLTVHSQIGELMNEQKRSTLKGEQS